MPKIRTELLKEGMVTASDILNQDRMLLIPAGCTLSDRHIKILNTWGIVEVAVEQSPELEEGLADPAQALKPEELQTLEKNLKNRFWHWDDKDAFQQEIYRLALSREVRKFLKMTHETDP